MKKFWYLLLFIVFIQSAWVNYQYFNLHYSDSFWRIDPEPSIKINQLQYADVSSILVTAGIDDENFGDVIESLQIEKLTLFKVKISVQVAKKVRQSNSKLNEKWIKVAQIEQVISSIFPTLQRLIQYNNVDWFKNPNRLNQSDSVIFWSADFSANFTPTAFSLGFYSHSDDIFYYARVNR